MSKNFYEKWFDEVEKEVKNTEGSESFAVVQSKVHNESVRIIDMDDDYHVYFSCFEKGEIRHNSFRNIFNNHQGYSSNKYYEEIKIEGMKSINNSGFHSLDSFKNLLSCAGRDGVVYLIDATSNHIVAEYGSKINEDVHLDSSITDNGSSIFTVVSSERRTSIDRYDIRKKKIISSIPVDNESDYSSSQVACQPLNSHVIPVSFRDSDGKDVIEVWVVDDNKKPYLRLYPRERVRKVQILNEYSLVVCSDSYPYQVFDLRSDVSGNYSKAEYRRMVDEKSNDPRGGATGMCFEDEENVGITTSLYGSCTLWGYCGGAQRRDLHLGFGTGLRDVHMLKPDVFAIAYGHSDSGSASTNLVLYDARRKKGKGDMERTYDKPIDVSGSDSKCIVQ